ncbi:MAG: hypothetical protein JO264_12900 [Acidisphaera sp.]|nr:hypothetical protein [Acidisphaera sp.]
MTEPVDLFIDFAEGGNSGAYKGAGWSDEEETHSWMEGGVAELILPIEGGDRPLALEFAVFPFVHPPLLERQQLQVEVNGRLAVSLELSDTEELRIVLTPDQLAGSAPQLLTFRQPDAVSPSSVGVSDDPRRLGCGLMWLRCTTLNGAAEPAAPTALPVAAHGAIAVYGDAQARELAQLAARLPAFEKKIRVVWLPPEMTGPEIEAAWRQIGDVAQLWRQVLPGDDDAAAQLRSLAGNTEVVTFPRLTMDLLWPFAGDDPRCVPEEYPYEAGRYVFGDMIGASLAETPGSDEQLVAEYLHRSAEACPDPSQALESYAAALAAAEHTCDVRLSDFLLGKFQRQKLFHNRNDPSGITLHALTEAVIEASSLFDGEGRTTIMDELARLTQGYQGMFMMQVPVNPVVAGRYGLAWCTPGQRYRYLYNRWTFDEYTVQYIRWRPWCP